MVDDRNTGLYRKYHVERVDGSSGPGGKHENCEYFVLDINHDRFARDALRAYSEACKDEYPLLALDLFTLIEKNIKATDAVFQPEVITESLPKKTDCPVWDLCIQKECAISKWITSGNCTCRNCLKIKACDESGNSYNCDGDCIKND